MAGWTTTDWADADWAAIAVIQDFVKSVREKQSILGQTLMDIPAVGADVQDHAFWETLQQWIIDYCPLFQRSHGDDGVEYTFPQTATYPPTMWTLATLCTAAGISGTSFRRYTTHPDDSGTELYGVMQAGDIIGPWIMEDLQKMLNMLVWTTACDTGTGYTHDTSWTDALLQGSAGFGGYYLDAGGAWDAAMTDASGDYPEGGYGGEPQGEYVYGITYDVPPDGWAADAWTNTNHRFGHITTTLPTAIKRDIAWSCYVEETDGAATFTPVGFDSFGAGYVEDDFNIWKTDPGDAAASPTSSIREGKETPACPTWTGVPGLVFEGVGYQVVGLPLAYLNWHVTDGLEYHQ